MQFLTRIDNPKILNTVLIESDLVAGKEVIIQFTQVPKNDLLGDINALCSKHSDKLTVRFYSDAFGIFDCKLLHQIPQVKSLALDCMMRIKNLAALTELTQLQALNLGVYELQETDILQSSNFINLIDLTIGATKTKAFNLTHLQQLTKLKSLFIEGHTKNIEVIGALNQLNYLRLHGISKAPLDFVNTMKQLKTLELTLGGRENLDEIKENAIENLSLGRVRGFSQLNNLSNFKALKKLDISEQIQLQTLQFNANFPKLAELTLQNCKTLTTIMGLQHLPALHYMRIYQTNIDFDALIAEVLPASLKYFSFGASSVKERARINTQLLVRGYQEATWENKPK